MKMKIKINGQLCTENMQPPKTITKPKHIYEDITEPKNQLSKEEQIKIISKVLNKPDSKNNKLAIIKANSRTYQKKSIFKELGFKFNPELKQWEKKITDDDFELSHINELAKSVGVKPIFQSFQSLW